MSWEKFSAAAGFSPVMELWRVLSMGDWPVCMVSLSSRVLSLLTRVPSASRE